jgi:uncharacterized LabA/DUF88 family protein
MPGNDKKVRTAIYVDGFNLYYGLLKGTPNKWLDLLALFTNVLRPEHEITAINYYTAKVSARGDPNLPVRQQAYLNALTARIPCIKIVEGHFKENEVTMKLVKPIKTACTTHTFAKVVKTEEKGSDVNLALHVVHHAWKNEYDCAVVVSNDSDLSEALRIVKTELRKKVLLLVPGDPATRPPVSQLKRYANKVIHLLPAHAAAAQLPDKIPGTNIYKPPSW